MPVFSFSPALRAAGISLLASGSIFALSGCGALMSALGEEGNVMVLNVGDCFNEEAMNTALLDSEVTDVPLVDCSEEHDSEFFHSHQMTGDEYPGEGEIQGQADERCTGDAFTDFVGVSYDESEIYVSYLSPTQESWEKLEDREILCYLNVPGEKVTGTLEGSNR